MSVAHHSVFCTGMICGHLALRLGYVVKPSCDKLFSDFSALFLFISCSFFLFLTCPYVMFLLTFYFLLSCSHTLVSMLMGPSSSHRRKGCGPWWLRVATSARRSTLTWIGASLLLGLRCSKGRNDCRRLSATWKETCSCWGQQGWRTSMEAKESIRRSVFSESCVSKLCIPLALSLYDNLDVKWDLYLSVWMLTSRYTFGYIFMFAGWPCVFDMWVYLCHQFKCTLVMLMTLSGHWKRLLEKCCMCSLFTLQHHL